MQRIFTIFFSFLLSACMSLPKPLTPESVTSLQTDKTVVAFFDQWETIRYVEQTYLVLGIVTTETYSTYSGIWDASAELTGVHSSGFSRMGVRADSLYDVLIPAELSDFHKEQQALASDYRKRLGEEGQLWSLNIDIAKLSESPLPQHIRDMLVARGYTNLVWITHVKPFMVYLPALVSKGKTAISFPTTYFIFDLPANRVLFAGRLYLGSPFEAEGDSVKYFLEKDNLNAFKTAVTGGLAKLYSYAPSGDSAQPNKGLSLKQFFGLENRPGQ